MVTIPASPGPGAPDAGMPRAVMLLVGAASAVIVIAGMRAASGLVGPIFLALVLTIVTQPVRRALQRRLPTWLASVICLVVVYSLIVGLALTLVLATARFARLLPEYEQEFDRTVDDLLARLDSLGVHAEQLQSIGASFDLGALTGVVTSLLSGALGLVSNLAFILALVLFMVVDGGTFPRLLAAAADVRPSLVAALTDFAVATRRYLLVSTAFGLVVAVLDTVALAILDVPAPLLWGLLAFLTNYIPNIGFVIGLVPPAVLALLEGGPGLMLAVVAVYCVLNVVVQSGIQPRIVGGAVGLSATLTFLSLVFWSWVIGPLGAILAIPLSLLTRSLFIDADPGSRWLVPLVANTGADVAPREPDGA